MKNILSFSAKLLLAGLILNSCATSNDVVSGGVFSKRKVNKGFFFNPSGKVKSSSNDVSDVKVEKTKKIEFVYQEEETENVISENTSSLVVNEERTIEQVDGIVEESAQITNKTIFSALTLSEKSEISSKTARKTVIQEFRSAKKVLKSNSHSDGTKTVLLVILCFIIPFLAVYLHEGSWNNKCWLNLILCLLFVLPGVIHALIVCLS